MNINADKWANIFKIGSKLPWLEWNGLCVLIILKVFINCWSPNAPHGNLVSPLVCRGPWMSTVVLYCWCHSDSASVLLYFTFGKSKSNTYQNNNVITTWLRFGYFFWRYALLSVSCKAKLPCPSRKLDLSRTPF